MNTEKCDAYTDEQDIITIRSPKNVLCNYYMYPLKVFNTQFISAEHAYQWRFMMYIGCDDHAHDILDARTPAEAKEIASRIPGYLHKDWHKIKLTVMKDILHAKADCCPLFKTALIESVGKQLVECTQDLYWASGLPPRFTESTKPDFYPGKNHLGHVLESVRKDIVKEAVLVALIDTDSQRDVSFSASSASDDKPMPARSLSECDKSAHTMDEPIEHRLNIPPPSTPSSPLPSPSQPEPSTQPSFSTPSETVHAESSEQKQLVDVVPLQNVSVSSRTIKKSSRFQFKDKSSTKEFGTEEIGKTPVPKKGTITSMFDAIIKRKLSPEKEADTTQDDLKIHRTENDIS